MATGRWWPRGTRSTRPSPSCTPTAWWPPRRRRGPRAWPATSGAGRPRVAARRWWWSSRTSRATPARSSRWSPSSTPSPRAWRSPDPARSPSPPAARRATSGATPSWSPARSPSSPTRWPRPRWERCRCAWVWPTVRSRQGWPPAWLVRGSWSRRGSRRRSWPTGPLPLSSAQRWSTCSAGSGCARWATSPPCPGATSWPGSAATARRPGGWRAGSTSDRRPPSRHRPTSPSRRSSTRRPTRWSRPRSWPAAWPTSSTGGCGRRGSACTRVVIGAETEHGERLERVWRAEGALTAAAMADRLRWQLDGWLQGSARHRPTAGISRLWLVPDEIVPAGGRQLGFWGTDVATTDRATRAVARVQGLLGLGAVTVPEWRGSRDPATQVALVDAAAVDLTSRAGGRAPRPRGRARGPGGCPVPHQRACTPPRRPPSSSTRTARRCG